MAKYRKFIVACLGVVLMALKDFAGIELGITEDQIVSILIPILTAVGVWGVPNKQDA